MPFCSNPNLWWEYNSMNRVSNFFLQLIFLTCSRPALHTCMYLGPSLLGYIKNTKWIVFHRLIKIIKSCLISHLDAARTQWDHLIHLLMWGNVPDNTIRLLYIPMEFLQVYIPEWHPGIPGSDQSGYSLIRCGAIGGGGGGGAVAFFC